MRERLIVLLLLCPGAAVWADGGPVRAKAVATVRDPRTEPGLIGVLLTMDPGWHVYWRYPGASGMATEVEFDRLGGLEIGPLQWPVPDSFPDPGGGRAYGYSGEVMLLAPVRPAPGEVGGGRLTAHVSWLACRTRCVLGEAELELAFPMAGEVVETARSRLEAWRRTLPRPAGDVPLRPVVRVQREGGGAIFGEVWLWWERDVSEADWFPLPPPGWTVEVLSVRTQGRVTAIRLRLGPEREGLAPPRLLPGVVAVNGAGQRIGWELELPIPRGGGTS